MKTSDKGVKLIKAFEGLSLTAIRLAGEEYYTIGYGHYGKEVKPGQRITEAEAERLLRADLQKFEEWVNTIPEFTTNQNQFDALVIQSPRVRSIAVSSKRSLPSPIGPTFKSKFEPYLRQVQ